MTTLAADALLDALASTLDAEGVLTGDRVEPRRRGDANGPYGALPEIVLRPRTTEQVSAVLAACNRLRRPVVVQGGLTGLAGGARPQGGEVALSLERMRGLGLPDAAEGSILAEAGVALQQVQDAASEAGLMFGVDIGARGTATVGGAIATNAGGIRVLRYGMMRAQVLGLEAVLADGTVLSSLSGLVKDNAGYDLKPLFIGTEGTLGVVTRAKLKLHPKPLGASVAFASAPSVEAAIALLTRLKAVLGLALSAFEGIWGDVYSLVAEQGAARLPLPVGAPLYLIVESQGMDPQADRDRFEAALGQALEDGLIADVVLSASDRDVEAIWRLRDDVSLSLFKVPHLQGYDIGLPIGRLDAFLAQAREAIAALDPAAKLHVFGHLGDGNLHFCVETRARIAEAVFGAVGAAGGTVAAEHGVGLDKKRYLRFSRSPEEIAAMRRLKRAFDPNGILNPGRIFDPDPAGEGQTK